MVDPRLVVKPFQLRNGRHTHKILVADVVLRQQQQMIGLTIDLFVLVIAAAAPFGEITLDANDGFHVHGGTGVEKLNCAVHHTVISQRDSRHFQLFGAFGQPFHPAEAVEGGIFGVAVQMDKAHKVMRQTSRVNTPATTRDV